MAECKCGEHRTCSVASGPVGYKPLRAIAEAARVKDQWVFTLALPGVPVLGVVRPSSYCLGRT